MGSDNSELFVSTHLHGSP